MWEEKIWDLKHTDAEDRLNMESGYRFLLTYTLLSSFLTCEPRSLQIHRGTVRWFGFSLFRKSHWLYRMELRFAGFKKTIASSYDLASKLWSTGCCIRIYIKVYTIICGFGSRGFIILLPAFPLYSSLPTLSSENTKIERRRRYVSQSRKKHNCVIWVGVRCSEKQTLELCSRN
jgi:hypothetical protein